MAFGKHPSDSLNRLFQKRPFQGQDPRIATILFLSSDANYSIEISNHPFFRYILEYHEDGVRFWKKYNCHHPFLLPNYPFDKRKDGVKFHSNFSKLGLTERLADKISFIELLDLPTTGIKSSNKKHFYDLISFKHLEFIDNLITGGGKKIIFLSKGVLDDMLKLSKQISLFEWLDYSPVARNPYSRAIAGNEVNEIFHFSSTNIHNHISYIQNKISLWIKDGKNANLSEKCNNRDS